MTVNELMKQIDSKLTGDVVKDIAYLHELSLELRREENAGELIEAVAKKAFEIMPEDQRAVFEEQTFVNGKRMDQVYAQALKLVNEGKLQEAESILSDIADKIAEHYENAQPRLFSFRNPFEYHMYRYFYPNDKEFDRAPFDFANYLQLYGFVLLDNKKLDEAEAVLERAVRFNPVSADVRFELAELYKLRRDRQKLLAVNQDTLRFCTTADRIGRVLANMGFYCYYIGDFYEAAVFYFESLRFENSKPVELELQDVMHHMKTYGQKFTPPTEGQTLDVYRKYGLMPPPNSDLVNLAVTLANSAQEYGKPELEGLFTRVAFDLTNDPQFRERMEMIERKIQAAKEDEA